MISGEFHDGFKVVKPDTASLLLKHVDLNESARHLKMLKISIHRNADTLW